MIFKYLMFSVTVQYYFNQPQPHNLNSTNPAYNYVQVVWTVQYLNHIAFMFPTFILAFCYTYYSVSCKGRRCEVSIVLRIIPLALQKFYALVSFPDWMWSGNEISTHLYTLKMVSSPMGSSHGVMWIAFYDQGEFQLVYKDKVVELHTI